MYCIWKEIGNDRNNGVIVEKEIRVWYVRALLIHLNKGVAYI